MQFEEAIEITYLSRCNIFEFIRSIVKYKMIYILYMYIHVLYNIMEIIITHIYNNRLIIHEIKVGVSVLNHLGINWCSLFAGSNTRTILQLSTIPEYITNILSSLACLFHPILLTPAFPVWSHFFQLYDLV